MVPEEGEGVEEVPPPLTPDDVDGDDVDDDVAAVVTYGVVLP